jgi:hypothetical protein
MDPSLYGSYLFYCIFEIFKNNQRFKIMDGGHEKEANIN